MSPFGSREEYARWKEAQAPDAPLTVTKADLEWAAGQGLIAPAQAEPLWRALATRTPAPVAPPAAPAPAVEPAARQRFDLVQVAYYFGALLVISAMGWFMTLGWESLGGAGIFLIASAYAAVFALAGWTLVFPFVLTGVGIAIIYLAITYQRNQPRIERALLGWVPEPVRRALPAQRVGPGR